VRESSHIKFLAHLQYCANIRNFSGPLPTLFKAPNTLERDGTDLAKGEIFHMHEGVDQSALLSTFINRGLVSGMWYPCCPMNTDCVHNLKIDDKTKQCSLSDYPFSSS